MTHTYEVFVDMREYLEPTGNRFHNETTRYEIDAESRSIANGVAQAQARAEHPFCTEYDIRVTRLLK